MPKRPKRPEHRRLSRRGIAVTLLILCGVSAAVGVLGFDRLLSIIGDNAEFAILGRALARGEGFRYINHPGLRPGTKYPPGFPLMLAGWAGIFGESIMAMKILVLLTYIAVVGMTFVVARRFIDDARAVLAALLVATSATVATYSHQILSDMPYTFFSLLAIYLMARGERDRRMLWAGIAMCVWAYFVRTVGASLLVAALAFLLMKHKRREALVLVACFLLASGLWAIRNYTMTGEGSRYLKVLLTANPYDPDKGMVTFAGLLGRAWINLTGYVGHLMPVNLFPSLVNYAAALGGDPLRSLISVLVVVIVVLGGYSLRKHAMIINIYVLAYFAIYLAWPDVWRSERFMVPIAPLAAILFLAGLRLIFKYFEVRSRVTLIVSAVLVLTNLFALSAYFTRVRGYTPGWHNYLEAATWVGAHSSEDALVVCRKPFLFHLFSDRKTVGYPFTRDVDAMRDYLAATRPDYIVMEDYGAGVSFTEVYLAPVLNDMLAYIQQVHTTEEPENRVFRFFHEEAFGKR
jgi:4-amino-4-deoxy-L-arabinose transferase-like glycosyltransferase